MRNAMRRPEVSVVIPTRNRAGLLERTLRAALRQEDVEFEVVVVDDASTDDTTQRVTALSDGRVGLVRHDDAVVEPGELLPALLRANAIPGGGSSAMAKASLVDQAGDFDPRLQLLEDWDMWIRLAARGSAAAVQEPLVAYLVYGGNVVLAEP